jgi:hypothetical protein
MSLPRLDPPALCRLLVVVLLAALAGYALRGASLRPARPADNIPALVAHLEQHGIALRVIPITLGSDLSGGAFLTRTTQGWKELSSWPRHPGHLSHWQGTVLVQPERIAVNRAETLASWQEGGLVYGQLLLFGDPALLAEIRAALGGAGQSARGR